MSRSFHHLDVALLILISISAFTVSSRPIATSPEDHVVAPSLVLKSSDGEKFEVKLQVALQSELIRQMIVDDGFSNEIELSFSNITSETMAKVLDYCTKHDYYDGAGNNLTAVKEMKAFDSEFVNVHHETLFKLILASNELKIKSLLDLTTQKVADMIKGKTPEQIRKFFNIKNDFTPEEEEEVRKENA
ncbi:hypothetical protein L2E82_10984 [Cichorium intybus]|uniref:Uncharacterized protein n=1 Tax=Cichorium intybus TaxID=13427 RepID=A0ACB9GCS2_CICIN|nr:hypothetical protein L2E82_10984 [Cichorium intybus]